MHQVGSLAPQRRRYEVEQGGPLRIAEVASPHAVALEARYASRQVGPVGNEETLCGDRTIQAIAAKHEVHPNQVSGWKRQAQAGLQELFAGASNRPVGESAQTLALMRRIDELYLQYPFYGSRQMVRHLGARGGGGLVGTGCGG